MKAAIVAALRSLGGRVREWTKPEHPWSVEDELFNMGRKR